MATTWLTVITDAFLEINVFSAADVIPPLHADFASRKGNRILDLWNADGYSSYGESFVSYTLTPSLSPHTIGPTGTFAIATQPESIDGAAIVTGSGATRSRTPIDFEHDEAWYLGLASPGLTSAYPSDGYYTKGAVNGSIYLYPVPSSASTLELMTKKLLVQLALTDTFALPPGYQEALTLTLAEALCVPYKKGQVPPSLTKAASKARATVFGANTRPPRIATNQGGAENCGGGLDWTGMLP